MIILLARHTHTTAFKITLRWLESCGLFLYVEVSKRVLKCLPDFIQRHSRRTITPVSESKHTWTKDQVSNNEMCDFGVMLIRV